MRFEIWTVLPFAEAILIWDILFGNFVYCCRTPVRERISLRSPFPFLDTFGVSISAMPLLHRLTLPPLLFLQIKHQVNDTIQFYNNNNNNNNYYYYYCCCYYYCVVLYTGGELAHHCMVPSGQTVSESIPLEQPKDSKKWRYSQCSRYVNLSVSNETTPCDRGWYYDHSEFHSTIISDVSR